MKVSREPITNEFLTIIFLVPILFVAMQMGYLERIIVLMVAFIAALLAGNLITNKFKNKKLLSIVAWSNVITWVSPLLGVLTAGFTYSALENGEKANRKKYKMLSIMSTILSFGNLMLTLQSSTFQVHEQSSTFQVHEARHLLQVNK